MADGTGTLKAGGTVLGKLQLGRTGNDHKAIAAGLTGYCTPSHPLERTLFPLFLFPSRGGVEGGGWNRCTVPPSHLFPIENPSVDVDVALTCDPRSCCDCRPPLLPAGPTGRVRQSGARHGSFQQWRHSEPTSSILRSQKAKCPQSQTVRTSKPKSKHTLQGGSSL
jgi:hypothetical protein